MAEQLVVGVDGSPASMAAAEWAGREAAVRGAGVRVLNVWQAPASNVQFSPAPEGLRMWEEGQAYEAARRIAERRPGVQVSAEQVVGAPVRTLAEAADASAMAVLGSGGAGSAAGFVYGSVGLHMVARCDRPVVLVRAPAADAEQGTAEDAATQDAGAEGAAEQGAEGAEVVLGVDLGRPCEALLEFAFEEAAARGAVLRVVHLWDPHRTYGYMVPALSRQLKREVQAERADQLFRLTEPYRAKFAGVDVVEDLVEGPAAGGLVAAGEEAALLVVGRRRRHVPFGLRIGSVTHAVVHHAPCPVAVVAHD